MKIKQIYFHKDETITTVINEKGEVWQRIFNEETGKNGWLKWDIGKEIKDYPYKLK